MNVKKRTRKKIWERIIPVSRADKSWDIKFWQACSPGERFKAAFGMLKDYYIIKGKKVNAATFRLQRSVENIKQA